MVKCDETGHTSNRMFLKLWRGKVWKQEKEDIQEWAAKNGPPKVFKELLRKPDGCCYYFYYFNTSFYKILLLISYLSYFYIVFCHRICYAFVIFQKVDYSQMLGTAKFWTFREWFNSRKVSPRKASAFNSE